MIDYVLDWCIEASRTRYGCCETRRSALRHGAKARDPRRGGYVFHATDA